MRGSQSKANRIFISDCEGPISLNDNAFELSSHFIPRGGTFYSLISKYDDVLADVIKRPRYRAGYTLKLITPFLKAFSANNVAIKEYSSKNITLIPGAKEMLKFVRFLLPSFIVSTSYEQYMASLCSLIEFPYENVYCTQLDMDKYEISEEERRRLQRIKEEIESFPMIEIPENAKSLCDFSNIDQKNIARLDEIYWQEIPQMALGKMLEEINPVGGYEKVKAVQNIVKKISSSMCNVMYVGDSITDALSFRMIRKSGGLTISFNGNEYAIREAEIAVLSNNATLTSILADRFAKFGKESIIDMVKEWDYSASDFISELGLSPKIELITRGNMKHLIMESNIFRRAIRGEAIGRLG